MGSALFIALVLTGCNVGPEYKAPPAVDAPDRFHAATQPAQAPGEELTRWWTLLGDEKLDGLIRAAVRSNPGLRAASQRVRQARALHRAAESDHLPGAEATGSYTRRRGSEHIASSGAGSGGSGGSGDSPFAAPGAEHDLFQAGFDAEWELDVFGGTRRNIQAAAADLDAAVEDRRDVLVILLAEVARNYIELRGSQLRLSLIRKNIDSQRSVLDITRERNRAGLVSELDSAQAQSLLAATEAQVPPLETAIRQSIHRLGVLLGREPGALIDELGVEAPIPAAAADSLAIPVGLPSDLLRRRPDIRRAERQLAAATARIGVASADLFPRFSLTGAAGLQSISASDFFSSGSRYWSIGPTVRWPLFAGKRIHANIEVRNAQEAQARLAYEQAVLTSLEETENALVACDREQTRRRSLRQAVASNRKSVDLANELYRRGLTSFVNVLTAEESLFRAEDELAQSDRAVSTNLVALYKALGGGWEESMIENR